MSGKLTKHEIREGVFLLLFQSDLSGIDIEETASACEEAYEMTVTADMISTAKAVAEKYDELDAIIGEYSKKRAVSRISEVNKTILRLALYEINYRNDRIPPKAAVNEAVELAKEYADKPDSAFINGILGNYIKAVGKDA